ncbi:MAG: transporter [Hyphomonadaceae bacterium]
MFAALAAAAAWTGEAHAQTPAADMSQIMRMLHDQEARLDAQERLLSQQQRQLEAQRALIERQRSELAGLTPQPDAAMAAMTGAGAPQPAQSYALAEADMPIAVNRPYRTLRQAEHGGGNMGRTPASSPQGPVGEAPAPDNRRANVDALPEGAQIARADRRWTIEPSLEYSNSSGDRLVFRGAVIVNTVQVGLIEANQTSRDTVAAALAVRRQITDRLEIEGRLPWLDRNDRVTTLVAQQGSATQTTNLHGSGLGDAELSARYQLNTGASGLPIFVASLRYKSDTGKGPFDVARDGAGVATELATGSGFWGVQGGLSMLYATDPAVLFANVSYLYNAPKDINQDVGGAHIGEVDPGDSIGLGLGFGFALNDRFSYSLSYAHNYIMKTTSEIAGTQQSSTPLQVGALSLGMSLRLNPRTTIATSFDVGVTQDAPDIRLTLRTPLRF